MRTPSSSNPLSARGTLEVLDHAFRIYRNNFLTFTGIAALVLIPMTFIGQAVNDYIDGPWPDDYYYDYDAGYLITAAIRNTLVNGLIVYAASENHLGHRLNIIKVISGGWRRLFKVGLGYTLLYIFLVISGIGLYFYFSFIEGWFGGDVIETAGVCCAPFFVLPPLAFLFYIYINTNAFLTPTIALENVGARMGLFRAWTLAKSRFWRVFGVVFVIWLITIIIGWAFNAAESLAWQTTPYSVQGETETQIINTVLGLLVSIVITPMLPICLTLMYYDTRARLEGLDIALQTLDRPDARPSDIASPPADAGMNDRDWKNIAILCVIVVVLVIVLYGLLFALIRGPYYYGF